MSTQTDTWRKSSYSANGNDCVEVGHQADGVVIRDTKANGNGPVLRVSAEVWQTFTNGLK
jgi:Domain of unknown function (DUF397)